MIFKGECIGRRALEAKGMPMRTMKTVRSPSLRLKKKNKITFPKRQWLSYRVSPQTPF